MNNFKFLISFSFIFIFTSYFFSQQQNNLQNQGNVGIGTTTPSKSFEVVGESEIHGKLSIDSSLLVKDTASFERNVSFSEKVDVTGEGKFRDNLRVYGGLEVVGPTMLYDNLQVGKKVFFNNVNTLNTIENEGFLIIDSTGLVKKGGMKILQAALYEPEYQLDCSFLGYKPVWSNDIGKIYTAHLTGENCEANVGIGTDDPQSKLHVSGTTRTSRLHTGDFISANAGLTLSAYRVGTGNASNSIARFGRSLNNDLFTYFDLRMDGTLRMQNATRDVFLVDVQDEVVYARKIVVDEEAWPDYVFNKDYNLMPLKEVQSHIDEHGHLPNVPSAKEVEENGVDLGETAKITMEKVEELTLYLIEQQELLEKQQELLEQQQKEIEQLKAELKR